jgi:hypothetical protein
MDASDFETSRIYKERSLDLVSKICKELGIEDARLSLAYAERGISRIQDKRYEEGEADLKEEMRIRKALGNYVPQSARRILAGRFSRKASLKNVTRSFWTVWRGEKRLWARMIGNLSARV